MHDGGVGIIGKFRKTARFTFPVGRGNLAG